MQPLSLSIRVDATNPDHHLWSNNGTWWCHYTLHCGPRKQRCRVSPETGLIRKARLRRDQLFDALLRLSGSSQFADPMGRANSGGTTCKNSQSGDQLIQEK